MEKFTGKHLRQSLFFNEVAERLCHRIFPVNFAKFLRAPILLNTSRRLLLQCVNIWFWDHFFKKDNLLGKALKPPLFCSPFFWLTTFFQWKQNIDYSSSLPYLIDGRILTSLVDANWLIGFIFDVKWLGRKSHIIKTLNRIKTPSRIRKI